jgi:hypothetical protein
VENGSSPPQSSTRNGAAVHSDVVMRDFSSDMGRIRSIQRQGMIPYLVRRVGGGGYLAALALPVA